MSFILPLPRSILECKKIILLPQLSTREKLLKLVPKYFSSGPKIFDCFIPLIGKQGELLISPFLGHVGVCTLLEQVLEQSDLDITVYFFGSCGGYSKNGVEVGSHVSPDCYYIEEKLDEITCIKKGNLNLSILSTAFLSSESAPKLYLLNRQYGITLIDMELSFVQRVCQKLNRRLVPNLLVTDVWDGSVATPTPKAIKSLPDYADFLELIVTVCQ